MFLEIKNVLTEPELARLRELAATLNFVDGRVTNPGATHKRNLQIDQNDPTVAEPGEIVRNALFRNPELREFAFPVRLARPTLSKYQPGMQYGKHVDAALFPAKPNPMRSDVSCTVFISELSEYEGGELTIHLGHKTLQHRGESGSAVFYPSTTVHEVMPVTGGERLVAVAWMQSYIKDPQQRELLHYAYQLTHRLGPGMDEESRMQLEALRTNLFRMWSEVS